MKLVSSRNVLTAAFTTVASVVPSRTPKQVLQNTKIEAASGSATLIGTDQEVAIRYKLPEVDVQQPGEMLLPTNRTLAILRELQGESVSIESTGDATWVRGERAEYRLGVEDPAEFPPVAEFNEKAYHTIPAGLLKQLIKRTVFATDAESTRYALGGVLVDLKGDNITFAATDTRRLAVAKGTCGAEGSPKNDNPAPVVPVKALQVIDRSLADENEQVCVALRANDLLVKTAHSTIYSRLVEGRFPRYQDVIPASSTISVELVTGSFYSAVRQAQIVTSEESRGVDFTFSNGLLTLKSASAEVGESKIELPVSYDAADLTITFDPRYVAEFLRVLEPEKQIKLELTDGESAAVLRTDDGYLYIIMPLSRDR